MTTATESYKSTGLTFLGFATCASAALTIWERSILSVEASHVSLTARPEKDELEPTNVIFGLSSSESFALLGPDGCWLKTYGDYCQVMIDGSSEPFSETWPTAGTMRNGQLYRRAPWVRHTHAKECSLWPTPQKNMGMGGGSAREAERVLRGEKRPSGNHIQRRLPDFVRLRDGGPPNPAWVEWLMGFPPGWTDLEL